MKRYSESDEEKVRMQDLVREWHRSGLLEASQTTRLRAELAVDLKRANPFVRALIFLFTTLVIGASFGFVSVLLQLRDPGIAILAGIAAPVCFLTAEYLVTRFRLYRFGIEEACATCGVLSLAFAVEVGTSAEALAVALAGLAAFGVFLRFGYLYAALGAIACVAALPFQFGLEPEAERVLAALVLATVFSLVRKAEQYDVIAASSWAGIYVALNLQLGFRLYQGAFYWWTYLMIWILPIIGIRMGIRQKHRALIDANLVMVLVTLASNKPYLRLTRQPWDPILFGILLIGAAIVVRRWLRAGVNGERHGFTPERLLNRDLRVLSVAATATSALQFNTPAPTHVEPKPDFSGGRSGGAGASGSF
jgi:hypothetical protein